MVTNNRLVFVSDFILVNGQADVGLVTATGGTLIANGVTTVHTTRVFGTYLNGGNYAQIIQSTAKVFEDDIKATPVAGFAGSVQHVTEKPGFGLEIGASGSAEIRDENLPLESLFDRNNIADDSDIDNQTPTGIASRIQERLALKKSTQQEFKARLKSRFDRFKQRVSNEPREQNIGRGSVSQISLSNRSNFGRSTTGFRSSRERSRGSASVETTTEAAVDDYEDYSSIEESIGSRAPRNRFRERSRIRPAASRIRPVTIELKPESVEELLGNTSERKSTTSFGSRSRNRFRDRISPSRQRQETRLSSSSSIAGFRRPEPSKSFLSSRNDNDDNTSPTAPKISFKKFNRFDRPDIRQSLLSKILGKGKGKNTLDPEEQKTDNDLESEKLIDNTDDTVDILPKVNDLDPLQTTLRVSTVFPENKDKTSTYLEVATIRSPYSFAIEEGMSTRFITVTR